MAWVIFNVHYVGHTGPTLSSFLGCTQVKGIPQILSLQSVKPKLEAQRLSFSSLIVSLKFAFCCPNAIYIGLESK